MIRTRTITFRVILWVSKTNFINFIGAALTDTPAGIAAYALEKMGVCCNRNQLDTLHGGLENIDMDDLLDTVTIMWANEKITYSIRIYAEAFAWPEVFVLHK